MPTRFNLAERVIDADWRDHVENLDGPPIKLRTTVTEERPKSILTFNRSPDVPFDRSVIRLSRLRAWLHLLLCAPDSRLSRPVARSRISRRGCSRNRMRRVCCVRR